MSTTEDSKNLNRIITGRPDKPITEITDNYKNADIVEFGEDYMIAMQYSPCKTAMAAYVVSTSKKPGVKEIKANHDTQYSIKLIRAIKKIVNNRSMPIYTEVEDGSDDMVKFLTKLGAKQFDTDSNIYFFE